MPFRDIDRESVVPTGLTVTPFVSEHDRPDPTLTDTLSAAWQLENVIGSALEQSRYQPRDFDRVDPEFDTYQAAMDAGREADINEGRFDDVHNENAFNARVSQLEAEEKNRATLAASGMTGLAMVFGVNLIDPTILIPGGALRQGALAGYRVAKSAAVTAAAAAAGTAVQETILQGTQQTRTGLESAAAIGGSAVLGGMVGGGLAAVLNKTEWNRISRAIELDLADETPSPADVAEKIVARVQGLSAEAAQTELQKLSFEDLGVGGPRAARSVAAATAALQINPGLRTMLSPSVEARRTLAALVDNPVYTKGNIEGKTAGAPVENLVLRGQRGALGSFLRERNALYRKARKDGYTGRKLDFNEAVGKAARQGDVAGDGDVHVTAAAQSLRRKIFEPYLKEMQGAGILPEDFQIGTAPSYLMRVWNVRRLNAREQEFRRITRAWLSQRIDEVESAAKVNREQIDFVSDADREDYIEDIVTSIFNNLTGRGDGEVPQWIVPAERGPLKGRTFRIQDELVKDFLEDDAEMIARQYVRIVGAETELTKKFGRADMAEQLGDRGSVREDYARLRKETAGDKKLTPKQRDKKLKDLAVAEKRDIETLRAFRDIIRGTYRQEEQSNNWGRVTRAALAWNYMRLLGGVTLTSVSDLTRTLGVHGVRSVMTEALPALVTNIRKVKLSVAEARELGAVTEVVLQSRLASLAELTDPYVYGHPVERMISNATNIFSRATGLGYWNDANKSIVSLLTQNRILRNATKTGKLGKWERSYMAFLGINEDMSGRIAKQFRRFGEKDGTVWVANTDQWTDKGAVNAYAAALNKDVDRTIVTKGVADQPLWTRSNVGRLIMQFKSFALASHQKVLIAGLQERPHRFLEMMVGATALGMLVSYTKFVERGDTKNAQRLLDNPGLWVADGMDRTGIFSIPYEISNTLDKIWRPNPFSITKGMQLIAGDEDLGGNVSRYASRNRLGALIGPTGGIIQDLGEIASQVGEGNVRPSGVNAAIRQVPGATLPGIRTLIHQYLKPAAVDALN